MTRRKDSSQRLTCQLKNVKPSKSGLNSKSQKQVQNGQSKSEQLDTIQEKFHITVCLEKESTESDAKHWTEELEHQDDPADKINFEDFDQINDLEIEFFNVDDLDVNISFLDKQASQESFTFMTKGQIYCE